MDEETIKADAILEQNLNIIFVIEMNSCDSGVDARNLNHVRIDDNH